MNRCRSAGHPCLRPATLTARIALVGERLLCRPCFDAYRALMGEDVRVVAAVS